MGAIDKVSFSRLQNFETCKYRAKLMYVDKIPEPPRPLPPGRAEHANVRGNRIHDAAEMYVRGGVELVPELEAFRKEFEELRKDFEHGLVQLEEEWAVTKEWEPTAWTSSDAWCRMKLDALYMNKAGTHGRVIDYKGLPLDTPIPTIAGWTTMEQVAIGAVLFDVDGEQCTVIGKSQIKHLPCYEIIFDDTSTVVCDKEHLWALESGDVVSVTELSKGDCVPVAKPIATPPAELLIDPYVLGVWLADGKHSSGEISKPDAFIWEEIQRRGYEVNMNTGAYGACATRTLKGLRTELRHSNLLSNKHIPIEYLRAGYEQRIDLLRGLMDGDGAANRTRKQAIYCTTDSALADQVVELLASLGQRPLKNKTAAYGFGIHTTAYNVSFRPTGINPFYLPRKRDQIISGWGPGRSAVRRVKKVKQVASVPTQCIAVDSPTHTFLCTEKFIPTHNTGKKKGNEIKHTEQGQLYQLGTFLRYPDLEKLVVEFWYTDLGEVDVKHYSRQQGVRYFEKYDKRLRAVTEETEFPPRATMFTCQWCPYNGNACEFGVEKKSHHKQEFDPTARLKMK